MRSKPPPNRKLLEATITGSSPSLLEKKCLSSFDDKRYLLDKIHTLAYGHYRIDEIRAEAEVQDAMDQD